MKIRRAVIGFGAITFLYLVALIWVDSKNQVFAEIPKLLTVLPTLLGLSLLSYLVRYLRWYWLLTRAGSKTSLFTGFLAYLAGFAFTATPGKVGELLRIRYLAPQGVPPWRVIAAFVYERAFDLIAVLLLSALVVSRTDIFVSVLGFVTIFLTGVVVTALNPAWLTGASAYLRAHRLKRLARMCIVLRDGLSGCRIWVTPVDLVVSMTLGLFAWTITSLSFVWLLIHLGISIPVFSALAIYPLAMLAGAASMLPGGVGSTEVAIVALVSAFNVALPTAALAAIGIRLSSLWFAIFCGFFALSALELLSRRTARIQFSLARR